MSPLAPVAAVLGLLAALVVIVWAVLAVIGQTVVAALFHAVGHAAGALRQRSTSRGERDR